jgi:small subunit ribosomal protein S25e
MGGTKKKTLASMEKTQNEEGEQQADGSVKKKTTTKEAKPVGERKRVEVLMPRLSDQDFMKSLASQKAITVYSAARALNVSASIAKTILSSLESKGMVARHGGYSGHYVWAPASTSRT